MAVMMKLGFICNGNVIRGHFFSLFHPGLRSRLLPLLYSTSTSIKASTSTSISPIDSGITPLFSEFLVNSLGFDHKQSITASATLVRRRGTSEVSDINFIDNANAVVDFFKELGFQHSQIKSFIASEPRYLLSNIENSLKPKIKVLKELGISDSDLVDVILTNHQLLRKKLEPVIDAFRTVMGSNDYVVRCLKRQTFLGGCTYLVSNVELLQNSCNVPIETIRKFVLQSPRTFLVKTDELREVVVKVEQKLGIPKDSTMFMYGIRLMICHSEKKLDDKFEIFKSYGWTQSNITVLMRGHPFCFTSSELMIKKKLDFLMNLVGYTPDYLMTRVMLFTYSVEKRLLPRYRVLQILKENGKTNGALTSVSKLAESVFVERFVLPFKEVHQVYAQLTGSTVGSLNVGRAKGQS